MKLRIIGLTGPKTVGKTTVANQLVKRLSVGYLYAERVSFADPMRDMLRAFGVPQEAYKDKESPIEGLGVSVRHLMQTLGTTWGRGCVSERVWLWAMKKRLRDVEADAQASFAEQPPVVVIDDCRFENEAEWIKQNGGIVVRVQRNGIEYTGEHETETELPSALVDYEINCDAVSEAVESIYKKIYTIQK